MASTLLLIPLDDTVVFPTMDVTLPVDPGDEDRVLLVPRHEGEYARVGTIARVAQRVRLPGGARGAHFEGVARGIGGAGHTALCRALRAPRASCPAPHRLSRAAACGSSSPSTRTASRSTAVPSPPSASTARRS